MNVIYTKKFLRLLDDLDDTTMEGFFRFVTYVKNQGLTHSGDVKKLVGYKDLWRLRIGKRRFLFVYEDDSLTFVFVGRRGMVYNWIKK